MMIRAVKFVKFWVNMNYNFVLPQVISSAVYIIFIPQNQLLHKIPEQCLQRNPPPHTLPQRLVRKLHLHHLSPLSLSLFHPSLSLSISVSFFLSMCLFSSLSLSLFHFYFYVHRICYNVKQHLVLGSRPSVKS